MSVRQAGYKLMMNSQCAGLSTRFAVQRCFPDADLYSSWDSTLFYTGRGGKVRERPVSPSDLLATLYEALGIPLDAHYEDASGRPVSIVGTGKPIHELL